MDAVSSLVASPGAEPCVLKKTVASASSTGSGDAAAAAAASRSAPRAPSSTGSCA